MTTDKNRNDCNDSSCRTQPKRPGESEEELLARQTLSSRMCQIEHKIIVLSGKGGVGKSTVAVNLAVALAKAGKRVGLLDVDIHGPSVPKLLHIEDRPLARDDGALKPVKVGLRTGMISVMSMEFLLHQRDQPVVWRGPRKHGMIKGFLKDVEWGTLDYLVVDSPPGTGDEPLSVVQLIENADGAVIVTTPQELAVQDVRRCIEFCRQLALPMIGVVENMSGFICPKCGEQTPIFGADGGRLMAEELSVRYLGAIPIDPAVVSSGDSGEPIVQAHPHSEAAKTFVRIVSDLLEPESTDTTEDTEKGQTMKIAVPVTGGNLSAHFGHCEHFELFDVDENSKTIRERRILTPPHHEPGAFPRWLQQQGANIIIAGGMGSRAQNLFEDNNIRVVMGASVVDEPEGIVRSYLDGKLQTGANTCDH